MSTVHAQNGHEQDTGAPRKVDRDAELVERLRRQEPGAPEALVETYGDRGLPARHPHYGQRAGRGGSGAGCPLDRGAEDRHLQGGVGLRQLGLPHHRQRGLSEAAEPPGPAKRESPGTPCRLGLTSSASTRSRSATGRPAPRSRRSRPELRSLLTTAIDDLPGDYKTAFLLHDVEGLSNPEIAETLHISLPAVKSRVHRSRLFLRQRLADYMRAA